MNGSITGSALNTIPLVNSTQILTASAQGPVVTASVPPGGQVVGSSIPPGGQIITGTSLPTGGPGLVPPPNYVPEDDYRLGRGILDDFRPVPYGSIIGGGPVVTGTNTPVINTQVGNSNIKDFL